MAFIRAREIEDQIRNRGFERGVVYILQVLAEQQIALQQNQRDQATLLDKMTDIQLAHTTVATRMKEAIERMDQLGEDGLDRNTQGLGNDEGQ